MKFLINAVAVIGALLVILPALYECKDADKKIRKERRRGNLGGASRDASKADCAKSMDIKLYKNSPGMLSFKPDKDACKDGPTYVGSTEDGKCHVTLVSSDGSTTAFAASVTCEDTGAVYSIGTDGNGTMTVVERMQADFGEELDPFDEIPAEERALLDARTAAAVSTGGLRGKVANQLRSIGDRFLTDNHHSDTVHRDLQGNIIIDVMVLYTADAECGNSGYTDPITGLPLGCVRTPTTEASIRSLIDLAIAETNTAYSLSGVNVVLNLLHAAYDDYVETDDMRTTLFALPAKPSVLALREAYGADVVAMIVGRGQYCGVGYMGPSIGSMYSVSHYSCATGYYTFGHELGHNFGVNHDRGSKNQCTNAGYAYGFRDPQAEFRSILAYDCSANECTGNPLPAGAPCTRVQRFSNTYALYNGKPIGDVNNDGARRINDVAAQVSNFFVRPPSSSPTSQPTTSSPATSTPTTSKPTITPTSQPTISPTISMSPTTSKPTLTPTSQPTTSSPTTSTPTTSKPTLTPTSQPTTSSPTTSKPTTSTPTLTPTSPATSKPTTSKPTTRTPTTRKPTTSRPTKKPKQNGN
jgi:hypothetical protein